MRILISIGIAILIFIGIIVALMIAIALDNFMKKHETLGTIIGVVIWIALIAFLVY